MLKILFSCFFLFLISFFVIKKLLKIYNMRSIIIKTDVRSIASIDILAIKNRFFKKILLKINPVRQTKIIEAVVLSTGLPKWNKSINPTNDINRVDAVDISATVKPHRLPKKTIPLIATRSASAAGSAL